MLKNLEDRVSELVFRFEKLRKSHVKLQSDHLLLLEEKDRLMEHNKLARDKIETMISRLRNLEESHG